MNLIRLLKNWFADFLIMTSGTWVGSPKDTHATNNYTEDESAENECH